MDRLLWLEIEVPIHNIGVLGCKKIHCILIIESSTLSTPWHKTMFRTRFQIYKHLKSEYELGLAHVNYVVGRTYWDHASFKCKLLKEFSSQFGVLLSYIWYKNLVHRNCIGCHVIFWWITCCLARLFFFTPIRDPWHNISQESFAIYVIIK